MVPSSSVLAPFSSKDKEWTLSVHEGLVFSPGIRGVKTMFACRKCTYEGDRLSHAKNHHRRIHINLGRAMVGKRKYKPSKPVSVVQKTKIQYRAQMAADARKQISCWRKGLGRESFEMKGIAKKRQNKTNPCQQQVLRFGESTIQWTQQPFTDVEMKTLQVRRTQPTQVSEDHYTQPTQVSEDYYTQPTQVSEDQLPPLFPDLSMEGEGDDYSIYGDLPLFCMDSNDTVNSETSLLFD